MFLFYGEYFKMGQRGYLVVKRKWLEWYIGGEKGMQDFGAKKDIVVFGF